MSKFKSYYEIMVRRDFKNLSHLIEDDLQSLLEGNPCKRTKKQKTAINYLQQLRKQASNEKVNFELVKKLVNL